VKDRIYALEGVRNFRDYGGYAALEGVVKPRKLFRAAHFATVSDAAIRQLDTLGVRFLVDLRRPDERQIDTNKWPGDSVPTYYNDLGPSEVAAHIGVLLETDLTVESVQNYMLHAYEGYVAEPRYNSLFKQYLHGLLDAEGGPSIVHCAAGKDRTGVACALVLSALGVDRDTIIDDYELTNIAVDLDARIPEMRERLEARIGRPVHPSVIRPMIGVKADYLRRAFQCMEAQHASVDGYLQAVLAFGPAERAKLKSYLLE
jgi:protein-tyrosine phosphatase